MYFFRLRELRKKHKKTQADIAEYLVCQKEVYRRYETGVRTIPVDFLIALSSYYEVSIDYIVGITDQRNQY